MVSDLSVSLGGFRAATERFETSANNLANSNSTARLERDGTLSNEPYRPQAVQSVTAAQGGVDTVRRDQTDGVVKRYEPSNPVADENGFVDAPNVNLAENLVNMKIASYDAKANLKAIAIQDEMLENTLDIFS